MPDRTKTWINKKWGKNERENRIEETFMCGLNKTTEIEMAKVGAKSYKEFLERVAETEAIIERKGIEKWSKEENEPQHKTVSIQGKILFVL
ncbi:hypothetical protein HZS_511 [Henneguya salminicola]|nr:hypothetical protein HZS_511 [Henneguya salminicola]